MCSKIRAKVRDCSSHIDFFECSVGLKQGEGLSPIWFSLFLEDLEMYLFENINSGLTLDEISFIITGMLFADDMVIFGKDVMDLQNSLDLLYDNCQTWGLTVNPDKSKIVVFRKRGPVLESEKWLYDSVPLETVDNFNYLGEVFNYTGRTSTGIREVVI